MEGGTKLTWARRMVSCAIFPPQIAVAPTMMGPSTVPGNISMAMLICMQQQRVSKVRIAVKDNAMRQPPIAVEWSIKRQSMPCGTPL